jgi:dephospho-CoA kinase
MNVSFCMRARTKEEPLLVGLTGGVGCGKTLALKYLEIKGFKVIDCDEVVHCLIDGDAAVHVALLGRWGEGILSQQGRIDRSKIAAIVFNNDEELAFLEGLLHPRVLEYWQQKVAEGHDPKDKWIVEVPLLFEKNFESLFHFTVCITSNEELQIQRLQERGLKAEQIHLRIEKQLPLVEKMQKADFVIMNNGTQTFLMQQLERLVALLG